MSGPEVEWNRAEWNTSICKLHQFGAEYDHVKLTLSKTEQSSFSLRGKEREPHVSAENRRKQTDPQTSLQSVATTNPP